MNGGSDPIRVLHVDSDPDFAETFTTRLERDDRFETGVATSASEGVDRLTGAEFDCVVSAYGLPDRDGIEFLETIRERGLELPFFLFTGEGSEEIASNAISAGVTDYFGKKSGTEQFPVVTNRIDQAVETFRTERELDATRRRYRKLVEQNLVGIYVIRDGEFVYVNPKLAAIHGYDRETVVGMPVLDLVAPEERDRVEENLRRRLEQGVEEIQYRTVGLTGDDERIDIELHGSRIEYGGEPEIIGAELDITEQKEYERELEASEAKYRSLFEDARDAIMLLDGEGFIDCNEMTLELFGVDSVEAFTERTPWELSPETQPDGADSKTAAREYIRTAFEEGESFFEWVHTRTGGTEFHADVKLSRIRLDGEPVLRALVRDITTKKRYERELENREAKYRSLFEDARDPIILLDEQGFFDCNEMALELFGVDSVEAFTERTPWELSPETQPDGADSKTAAKGHIETALEEGEASFEWVHTRTDGTEFPAEVKLSRFHLDGEPVLHELVRDITEQKRYERTLEEQRDTLEVLNQVLRHDVRNDLQLVTSYAEMLEDSCEDDEASRHATTILESARHAVELTQTARDIADVLLSDSKETRRVALEPTLESKASEVQSSYPESVIECDPRLPSVRVDADGMLQSVFENLLKNAIQHNDKDVAEVTVTATERDGTVTVRIADNGPGVPDGRKETVFGKGRTGLDSAGTGMGLYLVETLVTGYGGEVWIEDNDPEGSVFVVELPTAD